MLRSLVALVATKQRGRALSLVDRGALLSGSSDLGKRAHLTN